MHTCLPYSRHLSDSIRSVGTWVVFLFFSGFSSHLGYADTNASVAAGENHGLLLRTDGSLWSMGKNDRGQLGNGSGLERGLVGWWKFDGDATDSSGNGNDGTVNGATLTTDRHGLANGAYSFDGVDDYIQTPESNKFSIQDQITVSFWFELNSFEAGNFIQKGNSSTGWEWELWTGNGTTSTGIHLANGLNWHIGAINSDQQVDLNKYSNLAMVFDASNFLELYLDGKLVGYSTSFNSSFSGGLSPLFIGARKGWAGHDDPFRPFNGTLDDIRIYNRALSSTEVSDLYTLESQPFSHQPARVVDANVTAIASGSETSYFIKKDGSLWGMGRNDRGQLGNAQGLDQGLVGWWKFDGDATDSSGNGNDGTVNGATLTTDRHGQANGAYSFDGVDDYISMTIGTYDEVTFSAWLKIATFDNEYPKLFDLGSSYPLFRIGFNGNRSDHVSAGIVGQMLSLRSSFSAHNSNLSYGIQPIGSWINVVTSLGVNSFHSTFLDGIVIEQGSYKDSPSLDGSLKIGANNGLGSDHFFNGSIDDVRIYKRALSASEVSALYTLESEPEDPSAPIQIVDSNVTAVSSRGSHALFQKTDGTLWAMGANDYGQLGDGTTTDRHTPMQVFAWEEKASNSLARLAYDGVEAMDGKIYFAGGYTGSGLYHDTFESFAPSTNQWNSLPSMTVIRSGTATAVLNGKFYVFGGNTTGGTRTNSAEVYDPTLNAWSTISSLPGTGRLLHSAISFSDNIYLFGGSDDTLLGDVSKYDPDSNTWSTISSLPTLRNGLSTVVFQGKIWVLGGADSKVVEVYDPIQNSWTTVSDLSCERGYAFVWVSNDKIFIAGGWDGTSILNSIETYDPVTNSWKIIGRLPNTFSVAGAGVINGKIYFTGGQTVSGVYSSKLYVADLNPVTTFSAGGDHSRFVQADGSLWAMGRNHVGQLGDGTTTDRLSPLKVLDGNVTSIASGTSNGIVKTESGQLLSMGQNDYGQSLEGSLSNLNSPKTYFSQTYEYPSSVSSIGSNVVLEGEKIYHMDAENNQLQIFDTNASSWSTGTSPNFILDGTSAVSLNNKIYAVGGQLRSQIAWYKFDGDFNDSSGNNLILSDNGVTLTSDRNGDAEHALNFDGTDDSFSINYGTIETPESNFAYAFWAKPLATTNVGTQTTSGMGLYSVGNRTLLSSPNRGDDRGFGFSIGTNSLNVINHGFSSYFSSLAYTADLSGWNHYLFICQNNKAFLYLNGSFIKNGQQLSQTQISHRSYGSDEIGTYFKGQIDSLRIFSKNLSADEISLLWDIENTSGSTTLLKEYNPQTDSWADKSSHSFFLHDSASVAINGGLFQVGGIDENGSHSNRVFHFDGSTEVWSEKVSMITARSNHALLVHDAKIWAVGGIGLDGNATNSVEIYDPDSESWNVVSSLGVAYEGVMAWKQGNDLYAGGWDDSNPNILRIEVLKDLSETWSPALSLYTDWNNSSALFEDQITYFLNNSEIGELRSNQFSFFTTNGESTFLMNDQGNTQVVGLNNFGQLGDGTTSSRTSPVTLDLNATFFSSGGDHTLFIKQDGTFWGMGRNDSGQIGDGSLTNHSYPVPIISSYLLVVNGAPEGNATGGGDWSIGSPVTLTATPNPGYLFTGWSGDLNSSDANVTISPAGNMEVNATFTQDLNDNDDDNLTNFYEIVTLGTDADNNDTDGDGLLDGVEDGILGINPLVDDSLIVDLFAQREIDAHNTGLGEGNASGQQYVYDYRSSFDLYSQAEVNASALERESNGSTTGDALGRLYVQANPGEFSLYTEADLNASMASERVRGLADGNQSGIDQVVANPTLYALYGEAEVNASIASERTRGISEGNASGQAYLQVHRLQYDLFDSSDLNASGQLAYEEGLSEGNQTGIVHVQGNPNPYKLYTTGDLNSSGELAYADGFAEGNTSGILHVQNNARDYSLYDLSGKQALETSARFTALAEGNASGIAEVRAHPAVYDLLSLSEAEAARQATRQAALSLGFLLGVDWVQTHPREYALYDAEERARLLMISETEGWIEGNLTGEAYVLTHPDEFDWISYPVKRERERNASEAGYAEGFAEGIDWVLAEPATYSLRTTSERLDYIARSYSSGYAEGNATGIAHVYANRLSYGLSGDPERDERIQEAGELGYSVGEAAGRAEAIATAQADLFAQGLHLVEYLEEVAPTPYTSGWYHQPGAGWLWTDKFTFPYLYFSTSGGNETGWLYFDSSRAELPFYDYQLRAWKEIEP